MEAVPRLHMLWFVLKTSPEGTSFANLKKYIAEFFQDDPEFYSKEVYSLETLRNQATHPGKDKCAILKRYYCQLHNLQNRFPHLGDRPLFTYTWKDLYHNHVHEITDWRYELAAILFNIAASHTQVGASVTRGDVDGMKLACTHFQCAAWCFGELRERYANVNNGGDFMTTELLVFMQQVSYAQAQECILEKSLIDNRKPNIVAKVTAQIVVFYGAALAALLTGGDDGPVAQVVDSSVYKLWKKYVRFKISYLTCILYLYQGQHAEEQQKMGERVTLYQAAWDKLEEARKESKGLPDQKEINESLIFTADVVEAKRKNAKNENEFIYHEAVPELSSITAVQGANLVNGISFSVTDPEVAGEDIFARLVPLKAHEASSMYSEEKAKLLRKYGGQIEDKDAELASFMSSLTLDNLNISEEKANKIPQGIVDRCAALNANKSAIPDLIAAMSQLAEICADVEMNLKEISSILSEEEREEQEFQQLTGVQRTPNAHITELAREFQKYTEAHARAGESNDTLRKAMELHVNNLKILARPLQEIQQSVPKLSTELNTAEIFKDVKLILNKANEMKAQRAQFHADLRISVNDDDITGKLIAHFSEDKLQLLFDHELSKHDRITQLIDQNLLAQKNILQALTEAYAKAAPVLKTLADVKHKRETFFSSLAASYDVYEDLLAKSAKGLEFYKKLSGNVQKLLTRFKSAHEVQKEERQQRLKNIKTPNTNVAPTAHPNPAKQETPIPVMPSVPSSTPKLRDYLKSKNTNAASIVAAGISDGKAVGLSSTYIPPVRPSPLGSENPSQAICSSGGNYYAQAMNPNMGATKESSAGYGMQQGAYGGGYTNPMYHQQQQQQQNMMPGAYKMQASPNAQFGANANNQVMNSVPFNAGAMQQQQPAGQMQQHQMPTPQMQQPQMASAQMQQPQIPTAQYSSAQQANNPYGANALPTVSNMNYGPSNVAGAYAPPTGTPGMQPLSAPTPMPGAAAASLPQAYGPQAGNTQYMQSGAQNMQPNMANAPTGMTNMAPGQGNMPQQPAQLSSAGNYNPPATQPLYVATNQQNPVSMPTAAPPTLQAPYVINNMPPTPAVGAQQQQQAPAPLPPTPVIPNPQQYPNVASNTPPTQPTGTPPVNTSNASANTVNSSSSAYAPYSATTKHPGYSFNPQTGIYEYGSGYQQATGINNQFYGQYTSASAKHQSPVVGTTDSENANKINVATGFDSPIISHTKTTAPSTATDSPQTQTTPSNSNYYSQPYGYQPHSAATAYAAYNATQLPQSQQYGTPPPAAQQQQQPSQTPQQQQTFYQQQQHSIYMQSGAASIAPTQTTKSAAEYASSAQQTPGKQLPTATVAPPAVTQPEAAKKPTQPVKKSSNLDLLTDIDFSGIELSVPPPILPAPALKPEIVSSPPASHVGSVKEEVLQPKSAESSPLKQNPSAAPTAAAMAPPPPLSPTLPPLPIASPVDSPAARKSSYDNLSICSDLSSLDNNFDWDSVSLRNEQTTQPKYSNTSTATTTFLLRPNDPFGDDKILKYFHKEVERYEKIIESLNIKMLNGHTQLSAKWKELHDLLAKEASKRTATIAKLFPEKNRSLDCNPYDHARVKLEKNTDDYINAAYIKNLGPGCPNFIIAQTPQQNTITDFWSMIWSQKARTVACLHTPNEMLDPFWPQTVNDESQYDDFTVKCIKINTLSHSVEYELKLSMHGADAILDMSILQIKAWTKSSPSQTIGIARNALQAHQQHCLEFNTPASPLILNCLTGSERSELIAIAICAILATQIPRPVLINVIDVWYRICAQRQNALRDADTLEQSMQLVLNHAHDVLNKRGIMTSYQMKIAPQIASKEKEEIKDPLNELDPLWKLK